MDMCHIINVIPRYLHSVYSVVLCCYPVILPVLYLQSDSHITKLYNYLARHVILILTFMYYI